MPRVLRQLPFSDSPFCFESYYLLIYNKPDFMENNIFEKEIYRKFQDFLSFVYLLSPLDLKKDAVRRRT